LVLVVLAVRLVVITQRKAVVQFFLPLLQLVAVEVEQTEIHLLRLMVVQAVVVETHLLVALVLQIKVTLAAIVLLITLLYLVAAVELEVLGLMVEEAEQVMAAMAL
jgi:hypothetical protein